MYIISLYMFGPLRQTNSYWFNLINYQLMNQLLNTGNYIIDNFFKINLTLMNRKYVAR